MTKLIFIKGKDFYKQYSIFALILALSVGSFYLFSAMEKDHILVKLGENYAIFGFLFLGKISLVLLLGLFLWLVFPFFLENQREDWKIYLILGMRKRALFFRVSLEQLFVLVFSSITGLFSAMFFSKFFAQILVKLMGQQIKVSFLFSGQSVKDTIVLVIFFALVMMLKIALDIYSLEEEEKNTSQTKNRFLGFLGLFLIIAGYSLSVDFSKRIVADPYGMFVNFLLPIVVLIFCVLGTIFLFTHYPLVFKKTLKKRDVGLIVLENIKMQLQHSGKILSVIAIFSGMAFGFLGGAFYLQDLSHETLNQEVPVDFQMSGEKLPDFLAYLKENHWIVKNVLKTPYKIIPGKENNEEEFQGYNLLKVSDYEKLRQLNPQMEKIPPLTDQELIFLRDVTYFSVADENFKTLQLAGGEVLHVKEKISNHLGNSSLRYNFQTLIVSDKTFNKLETFAYENVSVALEKSQGSESQIKKLNEKILKKFPETFSEGITYDFSKEDKSIYLSKENNETIRKKLDFVSWYKVQEDFKGQTGILLYFSLFLGVIFFMVTPSVLMVHQLGAAKKHQKDYQLLILLGFSEKKISQIVFLENAFIFFAPLIIGIGHGFFALRMVTSVLPLLKNNNVAWWLIFIALYSFFYVFCCRHYYRWLKK